MRSTSSPSPALTESFYSQYYNRLKALTPQQRQALTFTVSGGLAGLFADLATHPLDTARARLQFERGLGPNSVYTTTFGTMRHIVATEGSRGLFKGFGSVFLFTNPAHAAYFGGYELAKKVAYPTPTPLEAQSPAVHFAAGIVANFAGGLIWNPQDVVKQKLQVQEDGMIIQGKYKNSWHALKLVTREEGASALFRGFWASMLVYCPYVGLHLMCYEQTKITMAKSLGIRDGAPLPFWAYLSGSLLSSSFAAGVTSPFDLIKTRMQVQCAESGGYTSIYQAFKSIGQNEGIRAYFKGTGARMAWLGPNSALYELFKESMSDLE